MIPQTRLRFAVLIPLLFPPLLSTFASAEPKIHVVVSVDWEGRDITPENIAAMKAFRTDFPGIPLQMFLNAAYFTKVGANPKQIVEAMNSVLAPGDEKGLHIHGWKSLIEASGVKFRSEPAFRGPIDMSKCVPDCGHDVNITAYSEAELRKVIAFSLKTLEKNGMGRAKTFRAGAWQADKKVLRALAAEGIVLDDSATDAEFLKERWGKTLLYPVTKKIWPDTVAASQPYWIDLGQGHKIQELPNNGCLADYVSGESILKSFQANRDLFKKDPSKDVYLSIGFHQETAVKFLPNLRKGIELIRAEAAAQNLPVDFTVPSKQGLKI
ncbi:MAG: hypothetical protein H7249_09525 [Chitinophagaceae bacterium]|nr:hypothetical protein [Oligoflexus sp.]